MFRVSPREAASLATPTAFPVSFEVYPPRSPEHLGDLHEAIDFLSTTSPDFISVTFGAGGSSARDSLGVLDYIHRTSSALPLAHLTCVGNTRDEARGLISSFLESGITHFLALRGDLPLGQFAPRGDLPHASDLVALLRDIQVENKAVEKIAVAAFPNGHPESRDRAEDFAVLLKKQEAGATLAITQLFFVVEEYENFVSEARKAGVTMEILPAIMPITSLGRLARVLELTGETAPQELTDALAAHTNSEDQKKVGIEWSARMTQRLRDGGAPGVHLYAFNQYPTVLSVLEEAGVR